MFQVPVVSCLTPVQGRVLGLTLHATDQNPTLKLEGGLGACSAWRLRCTWAVKTGSLAFRG